MTIVYPDGRSTFWDLFSGRIRRVIVQVRQLAIPAELLGGDYRRDPEFRAAVQRWLGQVWTDKDALIGRLARAAPG